MASPSVKPLALYHQGCDSRSKSQHPDCIAAIHRGCQAFGYSMGLPQEVGDNAFGVSCFNANQIHDVSIEVLNGYHDGCDSVSKSQHPDCAAAAHRFCNYNGFGLGTFLFGEPQEVGSSAFLIGCFGTAQDLNYHKMTKFSVGIDELRSKHSSCSDTSKIGGQDCVAAIHRVCNDRGFNTGTSQEVIHPVAAVIGCFNAPLVRDFSIRLE